MKIHTTPRVAAAILAAGLLFGACGDDSDDGASTTTVASDTTDQAPDSASDDTDAGEMDDEAMDDEAMDDEDMGDAEESSIVAVAVADGRFTTLVAAVEAAGLVETLSGPGPFTVLAPTDDAFAALPEGTVEALLEDPAGDLTAILTYHVLDGEFPAADVVTLDGQSVETLNGESFMVTVDGEDVILTDAAGNDVKIIITDVEADNGFIHVIDAVLLPA